jgi:hydrogenase expression/formation protein HypC
MCLGVPGKVLAVDGLAATVDFFGVRKVVRLDICDEPVAPGDYVLNHVGFAIHRIPDGEIAATLSLYDSILQNAGAQDLMAADVRSEIQASEAAVGRRS